MERRTNSELNIFTHHREPNTFGRVVPKQLGATFFDDGYSCRQKTERNFHHPVPAMSPARPAAFPRLFLLRARFRLAFQDGELAVEGGSVILMEGSHSAHLYTVLQGWAFRYKTLEDGRRQILNYVMPGDLVGLQGTVMGKCSIRWRRCRQSPYASSSARASIISSPTIRRLPMT